jgi:nitroimidazol reductase NimA-like FMN-containing flavoprotein (pyridoxamine 5'-phosphate oxidase superfamily)
MDPVKIPKMPRAEYDSLIKRQYVSRIAFVACEHPNITPFMYVSDGKYLYVLSTKYGRKIEYFQSTPKVSVEIEEYAPDLSAFMFVSLQGFFKKRLRIPRKKKEGAGTVCWHYCEKPAFAPGAHRSRSQPE